MTITSPALAAKPSASIYRHPGFLAFISARLMAVFATQIQAVVVAWQVYDLTRDPSHAHTWGWRSFTHAVPAAARPGI